MIIDRHFSNYIVFCEDNIIEALKKISKNQGRIVFSVTEKGVLNGVLTNGDFRRWLANHPDFDVTQPISRISNPNFQWAYVDDDPERIIEVMGQHTCLPLVDRTRHLVAFARNVLPSDEIRIGKHLIGDGSPVFTIAEIGLNHNGSVELARRLIELAAQSGADCAKFQMRDMSTLYRKGQDFGATAEDLGAQYTMSLLERYQLTPEQMFELFDHCEKCGVIPLCTPWDVSSLERLERYGMKAYKVASADLTNHDLLAAIAETRKPVLCSTGMSTENEIVEAVEVLKAHSGAYVLLHCNSTYPAPFKDVNLQYLRRLKEIGGGPVGYSGHERGINVVLAAVAMGAQVIEKHFTVDKEMEGNDHKVSLLPEEFAAMVQGIRQIESARGTSGTRTLTQGELINRTNLAKSLVINRDLPEGEVITETMIEVKSPGRGLQPNRRPELIGRRAVRTFHAGDFFFPSDLGEQTVRARQYTFRRPWGVAVRYHDFRQLIDKSNFDLLEFHLSFKDMDEEIDQFFDCPVDLDLVVHSPELFAGDHLMNLCSKDETYRQRSVEELQRVVNITRRLKTYFKKATRPPIIINAGGFSSEGPLARVEREKMYELVADSLSQVNQEGVEIIPQTMPPFPWLFGGQQFHNLFMEPEDTAAFCDAFGYRLCFDVCHTGLACANSGRPLADVTERLAPYTRHLHIADAAGVDGEGLQIGQGDIDFRQLGSILNRLCPNASFIPEIWQGHKNEGEGFWIALNRLEGAL
jgi:N-acetylneuraminate synthase